MDQLHGDRESEPARTIAVAPVHYRGQRSGRPVGEARIEHFTLQQWSTNHHCDFWTGDTLNGGILRFQP